MSIDLSPHEADVLLELLTQSHKQLLFEISRTDDADFRGQLVARDNTYESLMRRLESTRTATPLA